MLYSVVRNVSPGAICSYRRGRTEIAFFDDRASADGYAENCQFHHAVKGMAYEVDELSGDDDSQRAPNEMIRRDAERELVKLEESMRRMDAVEAEDVDSDFYRETLGRIVTLRQLV